MYRERVYCRTVLEDDIRALSIFSGEEIVDAFLFEDAIGDIIDGNRVTTGVFEKETDELLAFYVLNIEDFKYEYVQSDDLSSECQEYLQEIDDEYFKSRVKIAYLGVREDRKNLGIGTYIIEKICRIAMRVSTSEIYVEALPNALDFYENRGFVKLEENISGLNAVLMQKNIDFY